MIPKPSPPTPVPAGPPPLPGIELRRQALRILAAHPTGLPLTGITIVHPDGVALPAGSIIGTVALLMAAGVVVPAWGVEGQAPRWRMAEGCLAAWRYSPPVGTWADPPPAGEVARARIWRAINLPVGSLLHVPRGADPSRPGAYTIAMNGWTPDSGVIGYRAARVSRAAHAAWRLSRWPQTPKIITVPWTVVKISAIEGGVSL